MELVAYVAGETWSASPQCACPVLTSFCVAWNDSMDDKDRQKLKAYVPRLVGTRSTKEIEKQRSYMCVDWLIREFAPAWLSKAGLRKHAKALRDLPELTTLELVNQAEPIISAARSAANSAANSAACSAACSAAYLAACSAACSAAGSAANSAACSAACSAAYLAAYSAANSAAYSAAYLAAYSAANSAAYLAAYLAAGSTALSALAPTVKKLQKSAFTLLDRMIAQAPSHGAES